VNLCHEFDREIMGEESVVSAKGGGIRLFAERSALHSDPIGKNANVSIT